MKKVLLVTAGIFHPTLLGRIALHKALKQLDGFSFTQVSSVEKLPPDLESYAALVLHYHHKTITELALTRLKTYVVRGGGILGIHAVTASFKETPPYFEILGGQFIGHGPVEGFDVVKVRDEIFEGIPDFTVKDELYIHKLQPGIEVHFTAKHQGEDVPVVWTYHYGLGKVCYAVPGHTTESMKNQRYQQLLRRALQWVAA